MPIGSSYWQQLEPLLPPQKNWTGKTSLPHRPVVNGILWVNRTGAPWRELPARYGKWETVASRFYRWRKAGIWDEVLQALQPMAEANGEIDWETHHVDSTVVRALAWRQWRAVVGFKSARLLQERRKLRNLTSRSAQSLVHILDQQAHHFALTRCDDELIIRNR